LPLARAVIRNVDLKRAASVAEDTLWCESADEVRRLLEEQFAKDLDPLWTAGDR
jgi:phosphoenolpyruvate-protein kinase (PTS system EI component)